MGPSFRAGLPVGEESFDNHLLFHRDSGLDHRLRELGVPEGGDGVGSQLPSRYAAGASGTDQIVDPETPAKRKKSRWRSFRCSRSARERPSSTASPTD